MNRYTSVLAVGLALSGVAVGQDADLSTEPILRMAASAPGGYVTGLAFSPDGKTLYEGGWDKVVRVWRFDGAAGRFVLDAPSTFRIPIGPGLSGAINAIAVSGDGRWLAVAGEGKVQGDKLAGFRQPGLILPTAGRITAQDRMDLGTIYLFDTETRALRLLRGHEGWVAALAFGTAQASKKPALVSVAGRLEDDVDRPASSAIFWDLERDNPLVARTDFPEIPRPKPGLAVWSADGTHTVAVSSGKGTLRLWNPASGQRAEMPEQGTPNTAVAYLGDGRLLTGAGGKLTLWRAQGNLSLNQQATARIDGWPVDFALTSRNPLQVAVVSVRAKSTGQRTFEYTDHLQIASIPDLRLTEVPTTVITRAQAGQPALASGAGFVALATNGGRSIEVLRSAGALVQRLDAIGQDFGFVAFVRNENGTGLLLNSQANPARGKRPRNPQAGDAVFDLAQRRLSNERQGWRVSSPNTDGWTIEEAQADQRAVLRVRQPDGQSSEIRLAAGHQVRDYILAPSNPSVQLPVLAVATEDRGQPRLSLHNAKTGDELRQFSGHTGRIRCLAFSEDGKLLASVGEDQMVCVWSLVDLDKIVQNRGLIAGVGIDSSETRLRVVRIDPAHRSSSSLREGDVIRSITAAGKALDLKEPWSYYWSISNLKPGMEVQIAVVREGRQLELREQVGQAIDERKPLFTLFLTRAGDGDQVQWIGWNPVGPYEASSPDAEQLVGWHLNPADQRNTPGFALAEQYRKEYYREGLLKELIELGKVPPPKPVAVRPQPDLRVSYQEADQDWTAAEETDAILVRNRRTKLLLSVSDFPIDAVQSVRWQAEEGAAHDCVKEIGTDWLADLSNSWTKPIQVVRFVVRTNEPEPREFGKAVTVRYQPPRPEIRLAEPNRQLAVGDPNFQFKADVLSGDPQGEIQTQIIVRDVAGMEQQFDSVAGPKVSIQQAVVLQPGMNTIDVVARNANPLAGHEELETSRARLMVTYTRQPVPPPTIEIAARVALERRPGRPILSQSFPLDGSQTIVAFEPTITLEGKIQAKEPLRLATWHLGDAQQTFFGFEPAKANQLTVKQTVQLRPGVQQLRFTAKTETSTPADLAASIEYRPALPLIALVEPAQGAVVYESNQTPSVRVKAALLGNAPALPFRAQLLVNGLARANVEVGDPKREIEIDASLTPGDNRIQLRLANEWRVERLSEPVVVSYRRPPKVIATSAPNDVQRPLVTVTAVIESPSDLPVTRVQVAGVEVARADLVREDPGAERTTWRAAAHNVPLKQGPNALAVQAWNADGPSREPAQVQVALMVPPPDKATISILEPGRDIVSRTSENALAFRVQSESKLVRLEILQNGKPIRTMEELETVKGPDGIYTVPNLKLPSGLNQLTVVAVNEGGQQEADVQLNYLEEPVRIHIESIEPTSQPGKLFDRWRREGARLTLIDNAPESSIWVRGRVEWMRETDPRIKAASDLKVWVNGFLTSVRLDAPPPGSRESAFRVRAVLNKSADNLVRIEVPQLEKDEGSQSEVIVHCAKPETRQHLHLLVIGVDEKDEKGLVTTALEVFEARPVPERPNQFTAAAFDLGFLYGPLTGYVARTHVNRQLVSIANTIRNMQRLPNHVVVVYFEGRIDRDETGKRMLRTSQNPNAPPTRSNSISEEYLVEFFQNTNGATVVFQDVQEMEASASTAVGQSGSLAPRHVAFFRYSWRPDLAAGKPDEKDRLLSVLREHVRNTRHLGELRLALSTTAQQLSEEYKASFRGEFVVDKSLETLALAKPAN